MVLKSARMARFVNENIPGIFVPDNLIEKLEKASNPLEYGVSLAIDTGKELKNHVAGLHVMAIGLENKVPQIVDLIKE